MISDELQTMLRTRDRVHRLLREYLPDGPALERANNVIQATWGQAYTEDEARSVVAEMLGVEVEVRWMGHAAFLDPSRLQDAAKSVQRVLRDV